MCLCVCWDRAGWQGGGGGGGGGVIPLSVTHNVPYYRSGWEVAGCDVTASGVTPDLLTP